MGVKDKLELERLYAILDDLESMYKNDEISEETYSEMKKRYKDKISEIQDKIMDFDKEKVSSKDMEEMAELIKENTSQISENVNEILKNTMRTLKMQLKSIGVESECRSYEESERLNFPLEKEEFTSLKCHIEHGKVELRGTDGDSIEISAVKKTKCERDEEAISNLKNIRINCKSSKDDNKRTIKISTDQPRWSSVNLMIDIPNNALNTFYLNMERGKVALKDIVCNECEIDNENGNIDIRDLECKALNLSAETGSVSLENVSSKGEIDIQNENGNITLSNVHTEKLKAYTEKGNISSQVSSKEGNLETELGSIVFRNLEDMPQRMRMSSELGSITLNIAEGKTPWTVKAKVDLGSIKNSSKLIQKMAGDEKVFVSCKENGSEGRIEIYTKTDLGTILLNDANR
ncbi:MAG: DUF4097 family beta strand repeat protein [Candidatus Methanofastidiosa archaeon]|nr:DUF4097 family beta strand repeat protein [Candidatus Methanofastidiosa archaeon]